MSSRWQYDFKWRGALALALALAMAPALSWAQGDPPQALPAVGPPAAAPPPPAVAPAPKTDTSAPPPPVISGQVPAGQWAYTRQYGWAWMPYGRRFIDQPVPEATPLMYLYTPALGWSWVRAPWVGGVGPRPYFSIWMSRWPFPWRWRFAPGWRAGLWFSPRTVVHGRHGAHR